MNDQLNNALGMLRASADWNKRTGGTLPVKLTCFEAAAVCDEIDRLRADKARLTAWVDYPAVHPPTR